MRRRPFIAVTLLSIAALFVSINAISGVVLKGARIDLTEDQLYAVSRGSQDVVRELAEPVDLTFYFSRALVQDYPALRAYGARVREMLQAFVDRSGGKLRLIIVDPEPFSEEEDAAFAAGLQAVPTGDGESIYFGLVARNALDESRIIPFFNPEREPYLEYELTRSIAELNQASETKIALITSLPMETSAAALGGPSRPQPIHLYEQLLANFDVETMDDDFAALPEDADILMIIHPWELDPVQLWAIDQFVLTHGRALIMVDPYSRYSQAPGPTGFPDLDAVRTSDLAPLLAAWGVAYDPLTVVLDRSNALIAAVEEEGRRVERPYPAWLQAVPAQLSKRDLSTAALTRGLVLAMSGTLDPIPTDGVTFEPLAGTSADSRVIDVEDAVDAEPRALMESFTPEGSFTLAARISGELHTAFPDGAPEDVLDAPDEIVTSGRAEIVVVADTDMIDDAFYVTRDPVFGNATQADNAAFLLNVIDVLSGSDALVGLRSRALSDRPMTLIDDMEARAEEALVAEQTELEAALEQAEARLQELQSGAAGEGLVGDERLAAEREADAEFMRMRDIVLETRARLREIERTHRAEVDRLEAAVIVLNVWILPLLVACCGIAVFVMRRRAAGGHG